MCVESEISSWILWESKRLTPKFAQRREEVASHASLSAEGCVARGEGGGDAQRAALTAK